MHRAWCAAGYVPDAFWDQTPATFQSAMLGAEDRVRHDGERDVALAHTIALFGRVEKLKPLRQYLAGPVAPASGSLLDRMRAIADRTKTL